MYTDFYRLSAQPFQLTPDHRFFFGSSVHNQAMAYLTYGLNQGEGFIIITGDVGSGKTTLVGHLLSRLDARKYVAAKVVSTQLNADDLLRSVANAFGVGKAEPTKATLLKELEQQLIATHRAGKRSLLVIDEVQNLSIQALEELRMISNFQVDERAPLQSLLLGQPQFRATLSSPDLEQLRQRVIASYHLGPLNVDETRSYIEHRLKMVSWAGDPEITAEAYRAIYTETQGVPRRINTFCSRLLLYGFLEELHAFDRDAVDRVAADWNRETQLGAADRVAQVPPPPVPSPAAALPARLPDDVQRRLGVLEEYVRRHDITIRRALSIAHEYFDRARGTGD